MAWETMGNLNVWQNLIGMKYDQTKAINDVGCP